VDMITSLDLQSFWTEAHQTFLPNARGTAVDQIPVQFWTYLSIPKIFTIELQSRLKLGHVLACFGP